MQNQNYLLLPPKMLQTHACNEQTAAVEKDTTETQDAHLNYPLPRTPFQPPLPITREQVQERAHQNIRDYQPRQE